MTHTDLLPAGSENDDYIVSLSENAHCSQFALLGKTIFYSPQTCDWERRTHFHDGWYIEDANLSSPSND